MKRHLLVLAALLFWLGGITAQTNFIHQDSVFARTSDCTLGVAICIDSIAYDNINDLRFFVDGQQYSSQFTPCTVNTVHNYSYSDIFRGGEQGPWRLDSWTVNGQTHSSTFNSLQVLLDSMRQWNPTGNWQLENSARIIYGFVASTTTYSCQEIFGTQKGGQSQVCYNSGVEYRGLRFSVPVGIHQLIVEKVRTGERDTVTLLAACLKPETVRRTVNVGDNATYCASLTDLLGTLTTTTNLCARSATSITFGTPRTQCIRYEGTTVGTDTACIEVCDRYGFCDTTYLIVTAATGTGSNLSFSDTISVGLGRTTCEVILPTGTINSFTNICPQNSGTNVSFLLDAGTSCVRYMGLSVGTNTACIRACNTDGVCDTTTITIQTIPYISPINPTSFSTLDTITVGLTGKRCSFNAPVGAITVFENLCAGNSGTNVAFTLDQATHCVSYQGIAIGFDTACIRVCNAALVCDTTIMYVGAIINGTGGGTNNGTGRTLVVRDTISIGLSRENCGVSVPASILSVTNICPEKSGTHVAFTLDPIRRCVTYRGLAVGADTACYVVCNANNICDTTMYIVNGVDTANHGRTITIRDTISVGFTRRDCRVSVPRGVYASISNDCPSSSGTNIAFTYNEGTRCAGYTGLLVGADTACIKVCNTDGICDTTIFIITAIENTTGGGNNACGLRVTPIVQSRSCAFKGFITLAVSGSTAPYTFSWADLTGTGQPQNRTELEAGTYTVTVSPAVPNCDTTLTITVVNNATNCGGSGGNRCGLTVVPTVTAKTCLTNGTINLTVTGSTAPYTFDWADLTGTTDPQNRTNLEAGIYSVIVTPSTPNCDTAIAVVVVNNATNCGGGGGNRCGLVVTPTATPKTCLTNGTINLAVSGSTAPYTFNWADLAGTSDPQNRTNLEAGTYTVTVSPSIANCDTTLTVVVANNATNCGGGGGIRLASVTVQTGDSTTFCVDSSRVTGGFDVLISGAAQTFSTIERSTPNGCFKIKGFVIGRDSATIILVGQNGVRDTTKLTINVIQRGGSNSCGLIAIPTATPKTCVADGSITLAVSGSTAPYTFDWTDLAGTTDPQNRTGLQAGTYTVKVTPSVLNCDTTFSVVIADNATNCGGTGGIRTASITVQAGDSTTYCVDSSRVTGGFDVVILSATQTFSTIAQTTPKGCFKITGFVAGQDSVTIVLVGQNGIRDTTKLTINVVPRGGGSCGLVVAPTVVPKTCAANGSITLSVSGSTAPYTFDWTDLTGTTDPQNRADIQAGTYTVKVSPAAANCDTTLSIIVADNCVANRCGLVVLSSVTPKTCTGNGSITLTISGSTAPYTFDWTDLTGVTDPQNRTNVETGIYTVKVTPSVPNCDTTLTLTVANNATNCGGSSSRTASVTVQVGDSTTFCVDSSRVTGGFDVLVLGSLVNSTIDQITPRGCFKIKGFVVGTDSITIILIGQNGVRDTTKLSILITPRGGGSCGLVVVSTVTPKNCVVNGGITLAVSGSTAPYTFDWTDVAGTTDQQNRTDLAPATYTVKVTSSAANCDTTLTIRVADSCVANRCGLIVLSTTSPKTCTTNGSISLAVTGSTAPYTFVWSDSSTVSTPQNRTNLAAGIYTVKVIPTELGCDTTVSITVANNATNCGGGNTCGIAVTSTAVPKTCRARGSITLAVTGGTAPYSFNWADLNGASFPQNRTNLNAGIYVVTVTSSVPNCDTILRITVADDSTNCPITTGIKTDSVTVFVQDSTTYCVDTSRISGSFFVNLFSRSTLLYSVVALTTPAGCVKIKGFVEGRDTVFIILIGQTGTRDTTQLIVKVVPRGTTQVGQRSDTIAIKILETRNYCPDSSRLRGSPVNLIKFCSTDPFNNTSIRLDTVSKCVAIKGLSTGQDTFCIALCNAAGFCDTTKLFVNVTQDTVRPVYRTDTVRLFVGDSLTYCNIDTGMIRGAVDTLYNHCVGGSGVHASVSITPQKCLTIKGLTVGTDSACMVVVNRLANLQDTTKVIIIVSSKPSNILLSREDSIIIQVGEIRNYCPDTSRLRGGRVTSISFCSTANFDNAVILLVDSTKCANITGALVGRDTACLVVCTANNLCDTVKLKVIVVPERPQVSDTVIVRIQLGTDSTFCGIDTTQLRGLVDTIYDACPGRNGSKARMVVDRVTHCVRITGVNNGRDTMCVVVCNNSATPRRCDTTMVVVIVSDTSGGRLIVIAHDDFDSVRRGTNKALELYNNDTFSRRPTSLTIIKQPIKGTVDTISFANGLVKYTASRAPSSCGLDSFRYKVCVDSICDSALVVVLVICPDSLQVYSAISPNGDGRNDFFLIEGLQNYPNHTVCIFNRWGNQVLNQKNYQNDWTGTWNGNNLPDGTYFYFIRDDDKGEMILTGYIQIAR